MFGQRKFTLYCYLTPYIFLIRFLVCKKRGLAYVLVNIGHFYLVGQFCVRVKKPFCRFLAVPSVWHVFFWAISVYFSVETIFTNPPFRYSPLIGTWQKQAPSLVSLKFPILESLWHHILLFAPSLWLLLHAKEYSFAVFSLKQPFYLCTVCISTYIKAN